MKTCAKCGEAKSLPAFHNNANCRDGKARDCKSCVKSRGEEWRANLTSKDRADMAHRKRLRRYDLSQEQFDQLHTDQQGRCAICGVELALLTRYHIDHCHNTNEVRGILCSGCNTSLGGFKDSPEMLQKAIDYLRGHK